MYRYLVLILLTSCATQSPQERMARVVNKLSPYCEALGYQRDTEPWRGCIVKMMDLAQRESGQKQEKQCFGNLGGGFSCY